MDAKCQTIDAPVFEIVLTLTHAEALCIHRQFGGLTKAGLARACGLTVAAEGSAVTEQIFSLLDDALDALSGRAES